ncbi:hypothetical protein IF2G_11130 [Cordyceps javanica]|nr:hypothetical protein IF2G_11130 [Cordyceps javanica]
MDKRGKERPTTVANDCSLIRSGNISSLQPPVSVAELTSCVPFFGVTLLSPPAVKASFLLQPGEGLEKPPQSLTPMDTPASQISELAPRWAVRVVQIHVVPPSRLARRRRRQRTYSSGRCATVIGKRRGHPPHPFT